MVRAEVVRFGAGAEGGATDQLAAEAPLEVRVNGRGYAVTMRTPGAPADDHALAVGFLVSEGLVGRPADVVAVGPPAPDTEADAGDVVDVTLAGPGALVAGDRQRHVYTTSSCGVCGLASIDAVATTSRFDVGADPLTVDAGVLAGLPDRLRAAQDVFEATGGLHAAGLLDAATGDLDVAEDVGRHNAVDKVVGAAVLAGRLPLTGHVLQVSGRASFELVQKAAMAGIPVLAAVSAPSSLAVDLARSVGVTLVGFSRGRSFTAYARPDRIRGTLPDTPA